MILGNVPNAELSHGTDLSPSKTTMSPRRMLFSKSEKVALFSVANGRCEACGQSLSAGWEGDHRIPFTMGGETDLTNGQALCHACNRKKGAAMATNLQLCDWQNSAFDIITSGNPRISF